MSLSRAGLPDIGLHFAERPPLRDNERNGRSRIGRNERIAEPLAALASCSASRKRWLARRALLSALAVTATQARRELDDQYAYKESGANFVPCDSEFPAPVRA